MSNYIAFIHSGIKAYRGNSAEDGDDLGRQCISKLEELDDPTQFPPQLLILLVSPAYLLNPLSAKKLLEGIHHAFAEAGHQNVPLIGCSAAAVFFNRNIYREGALLICLASRLLRAKVAVGTNATDEPEKAAGDLLKQLNLHAGEGRDPALFANHTLFTFFPGYDGNSYPAPKLHQSLRENLRPHTPIFGGVASADDPDRLRTGILFADQEVVRNALVAASVTVGTPLGGSLSQGLTDTNRILRVSNLSEDRYAIRSFFEGPAAQIMEQVKEQSPVVLLSEVCTHREPTVDTPQLSADGRSIRLTREINQHCCFRVMRPEAEKIHQKTRDEINRAVKRARIENPVGCLAFKCAGLFQYGPEIRMEFEPELTAIEDDLNCHKDDISPSCVGAFVDGEVGVDEHSRSLFINWGTAALVFGDELTERLPAYQSFIKLAELAKAPLPSPKESAKRLLQLIYEVGFRGAMISFWMPDQQEEAIVAQAAAGSGYEKIVESTRRLLSSGDVLAVIAKEKTPRFIRDSRLPDSHCDQEAISLSGLVSQYIIPLKNLEGKVNAILQFDLGDVSYKPDLHPHESEMLNAVGDIVNSILNRAFGRKEGEIKLQLEQAMKKCSSAETVNEGLQKFLELALQAFGLSKGHIRLAQEEKHSLALVAGVGPLYEGAKRFRNEIDFGDLSPLGQSFRGQAPTIINDAINNQEHQWMFERYREKENDREVYQVLSSLVSYANLPFVSESGKRGTICLFSDDPWFFTWFHKRALESLGSQVGFLLDTLQRKCSEKFLLGVNPRLSQLQNLDDLGKVLASATERFARAIYAHFASLFLWDEEQELYILRAQYGWHDPEWVNAARYRKEDVWVGSITLAGAPRYIPDLYKYYIGQYCRKQGHYNAQIFGKELSEHFTVEAIGLPLRIGSNQIGVMTLYRRIKEGQPSGFLTTDTALLPEGAASLTGLVKLFQSYSYERWERAELQRHKEIYEASTNKDDASFEGRVCQQALYSYRAASVDFYSLEATLATAEWNAGFRVSPQTQKNELVEKAPAEFPKQAEVDKLKGSKKALAWRRALAEEQMKDPQLATTAGVVERVCIPLIAGNELIGLLDLKWLVDQQYADPFIYRHSPLHLQQLGEMLGAAYRQYQLAKSQEEAEKAKKEAERLQRQAEMRQRELDGRNERAVKATGAYVFQGAHRMSNVIQKIYSHLQLAKYAENEEKRSEELIGLEGEITVARRLLNSSLDKGERLLSLSVDDCSLALLMREALGDIQNGKLQGINVIQKSLENLVVRVDPELTKEVFINLIDNAVGAMEGRERRELSIAASILDANTVKVTINDTGKGMTDGEIQAAMRGFVRTGDHKGVGVLISQVLLNVQGGGLTYRSVINVGTEAIVALPLIRLGTNLGANL